VAVTLRHHRKNISSTDSLFCIGVAFFVHLQVSGVAVTFNNTEKVVEALSHGVALVDRSHWGRLRVAGGDRLSLLHNQSTADFKQLKAGQGCDTVRKATSSLYCCIFPGVESFVAWWCEMLTAAQPVDSRLQTADSRTGL
jgi:hypothetical protein